MGLDLQNELIGAIKYIKAFAWERQWSKRAIDARKVELKVVIRDRINNVRRLYASNRVHSL